MAYLHTRPIVPHSRPSVITMYEGEGKARRAIGSIRPGSWGPMAAECKRIEAYKAGNRPCGPYTVDHIPSNNPDYPDGIWKIFRRDQFMRYADREDIQTLDRLVAGQRDGEIDEFVVLPRIHVGSGSGQYEHDFDDDLDGAFGPPAAKPFPESPLRSPAKVRSLSAHELGLDEDDPFAPPGAMRTVPPKRHAESDDPFDVAPEEEPFEAPPARRRRREPRRKGSTLEEWSRVIMQMGREQREDDDPFGVFEAEDDLDEAFG